MDSTSIDNTSFSPAKSETLIDSINFAMTIDNAASFTPHNTSNASATSVTSETPNPCITDFDSFEAIKHAVDNATTIEEQTRLSWVLPIVLNTTTQRYELPYYAEDLYHFNMFELTGKPMPPFKYIDYSPIISRFDVSNWNIDFTQSKLFKRQKLESQ